LLTPAIADEPGTEPGAEPGAKLLDPGQDP